jgi:hypothetical protein
MSRTRTTVTTNTENTVTFVQNQLFTGFVNIGNAADADISELVNNRERLQAALSEWLDEQSLVAIKLQICNGKGEVLDAYKFDVSYDANQGYVEFPTEKVCATVDSYETVEGAHIEINPLVKSNRSDDFGYNFSEAQPVETQSVSSFGAGSINVDVNQVLGIKGQKQERPSWGVAMLWALFFGGGFGAFTLCLAGVSTIPALIFSFVGGPLYTLVEVAAIIGLISALLLPIAFYYENFVYYHSSIIPFCISFYWAITSFPILTNLWWLTPSGIQKLPQYGAILACLCLLAIEVDSLIR